MPIVCDNIHVMEKTFEEFAQLYCETQACTPEDLGLIMATQRINFDNAGWMLLECQDLSSSSMGQRTILPYGGPRNTYGAPPTHPISPRGLASDMSVVIAVCTKRAFEEVCNEVSTT